MLQYTIKRLLLTIPTFFFISLLLFFVLNIAPGRPGASGGGQQGESQNQEQKESYRIFKEQFNLDKPILFNTRYGLQQDEVRALLVDAYNMTGTASAAERIEAQDALEDYGNYLVRHLVPLLEDSDPEIREAAARTLTVASRLRFVSERRGDATVARTQNREISRKNEAVKLWKWGPDTPEIEQAELTAQWQAWFVEHEATYTYTTGQKIHAFFLDTRFAKYWSNLLHLDFGVSNADRRPVFETVLSKLKYSLSLTFTSVVLAYLIAVPLGVFSAIRQGTRLDSAVTVLLFIMYSLPTFFTGTVLLRLLTEGEPVAWFPTGNFQTMTSDPMTTWDQLKDILWHLVLPIATYTSVSLAVLSRYARAGVIEVIRADYIRTARAKGLSEPVVIIKHAVRNGMIPILTLLGGLLPSLVAGSVIIEVVFNIPGMGQYIYDAINLRDYNAVMAVLLTSSFLALIGILISDLSYALVDPRISFD